MTNLLKTSQHQHHKYQSCIRTADYRFYLGLTGISPVESTIQWWVQHNNCNPSPYYTAVPNSNLADSSTVEKYYYSTNKVK